MAASSTTTTKGTTLVTPKIAASTDLARAKDGRYIPCPTVTEIRQRHYAMKGWYSPRDELILKYISMAELASPYRRDKDGLEDAGYMMPDGNPAYSIATFPFDILTQALGMTAGQHPYVTAIPSSPKQSEKQVDQFERFCQAILDMRMEQSNFLAGAMHRLMTTGWLICAYPYDPALKAQGQFPYNIQMLHPLGVYPMLDATGKVLWTTIERRVTGAQLLQDYSMYPGVDELIQEETGPSGVGEDSPSYRTYHQNGNNLLTTEFTVIRYYDDSYTALLLDATNASSTATSYNPALKKMKDSGKSASVLYDSSHTDNPYAGVLPHKLGRIPIDIVWCWPEARDATTLDMNGWAGRYVGLPFLFSQYNNWRDISRMMSQMHTILLRHAKPKIITTSGPNQEFSGDVVHIDQGEDAKYMEPPPPPPEAMQLMTQIQGEIERGTFGAGAYGSRVGSSGMQQKAGQAAGSVRLDTVTTETARGYAHVLRGIGEIMIARGDEDLAVVGKGAKYDGPYTMAYSVGNLQSVPNLSVKIKALRGFADSDRVAVFKSLSGTVPTITLLEEVLEVPNPERLMQQMKEEAIEKEASVMQPLIELAALKNQVANEVQKAKLEWQLQSEQDQGDLFKRRKQIELDMSQLPEETLVQKTQETLQKLQQQLNPQQGSGQGLPPQGPGGPPNPMSPPPGAGFGMPGSSMPPTSTPTPMAMPPSNIGPPPGMGQRPPMPQMPPPPQPQQMMRPPMAMPPPGGMRLPQVMPPLQPRPPMQSIGGPPGLPPGLGPIAKGPGQAQQPIQPLSRMQPPGGVGRPGIDSILRGPQGLPGQASPAIAASNAAVAPPTLPPIGLSKRKRRGKRGGK